MYTQLKRWRHSDRVERKVWTDLLNLFSDYIATVYYFWPTQLYTYCGRSKTSSTLVARSASDVEAAFAIAMQLSISSFLRSRRASVQDLSSAHWVAIVGLQARTFFAVFYTTKGGRAVHCANDRAEWAAELSPLIRHWSFTLSKPSDLYQPPTMSYRRS